MTADAGEEREQSPETVIGERSIASVNAGRSLQSRVSNILAMGLMCTLGIGLLGWYYVHTFAHQADQKRAAQTASRNQAAGEMALPSLGTIEPPQSAAARVLGPPPELAPGALAAPENGIAPAGPAPPPPQAPPQKSPDEIALERRLAGPVSEGPQIEKAVSAAPSLPVGRPPWDANGSLARQHR